MGDPTRFPGPEDVEPAQTPDPATPMPDPAHPATGDGDTVEEGGTEDGDGGQDQAS